MPEGLLLEELENAAPVAESLEKIEEKIWDMLRGPAGELGRIAERLNGRTARMFENAWRQIVTNVAKGRTAEMQAARPRLLSAFEKWLGLLGQAHALLTRFHKRGWTELPSPDVLLPEIAGMERLKACVFDLWQSADDLEELAARDYPLTTADLDQIGPHRRPPESWYAEESKPF
jgi:hypothetical protein